MKRSISRNTLYLLIGNLGGTALAFLLSLLIGRNLGAEALGIYSTVLAWVFSLSILVDFGISSLFTRDLSANPDKISEYLGLGLRQRWLFAALAIALLLFAAAFLSDNRLVILGLWVSAPLLLIENVFGLYTAIFRAQERMLPIAVLNIGMLLVQLAVSGLFIGQGILALLIINVVTSLGRLLFAWHLSPKGKAKSKALLPMLQLAWPFALAGLLAVAQQRMGILMLENLSDLQQVGNYAAVSRFIEAGRMIPNAFFGALFPVLANLATNSTALNRYFLRVMLGLGGFALLLALLSIFFAAPIMSLSYGRDFLEAEKLLQIGFISLLPSLLKAARTLYLYALSQERFVNRVNLATLALQFLLSLWLIPCFGALGLMLVLLLSESLGLLLLYWPESAKIKQMQEREN